MTVALGCGFIKKAAQLGGFLRGVDAVLETKACVLVLEL